MEKMDETPLESQWQEEMNQLRLLVARLEAERERVQHQLEENIESNRAIRLVLDESSDPIFSFYADGTYRYVNQAFAAGVQRQVDEIIGHKIWDVFSKEEADKRYSALRWVFENGQMKVIEVRVPRSDGDLYFITTIKPILDENGSVAAVICISKDITERKRMEEELRQMSTHDALTGLYNRHYFEMELNKMQAQRMFPVSILLADLDGLKEINDQQGHAAGDELLRQTARILSHVFRSEDIVARVGGDEFAVLLQGLQPEVAEAAVMRLRERLAQATPPICLSIGVATEWEGCLLLEVMHLADERMYEEKRQRKQQRQLPNQHFSLSTPE